MGKAAFAENGILLKRGLNKKVKKRIIETIIWIIDLFGSDTLPIRKEDMKRLAAFEMWMWRRMERITWKDRVTNDRRSSEKS